MQITIEVPDDLLIGAARQAVHAEFWRGDRYTSAGVGYTEIARQTRNHLAGADYDDLIRAEVARQLPGAISAAVEEVLGALIKRELGRMRKNGDLAAVVQEVGDA